MKSRRAALALAVLAILTYAGAQSPATETHSFQVGDKSFLLDSKELQIRCGEIHLARVPREYWRDRLRRCRAMGLNTVCAYLFWNFHERRPGEFTWDGQADAAEFCRLAQSEGLWVILRPGPYACAEWEMGGLPWWLLKHDDIKLRTRDPRFLEATNKWMTEVGRVLAPLQVNRGGPILMVQVENEYGFYGKDADYMVAMREAIQDAGFTVPLFACNPPHALKNGTPPGLFQVVNFGKDPAGGFKALRAVQPTGPLMCGEFYPGWFDTWGAPHHLGNTQTYLVDLEYMLKNNASFSLYMAHGGTTWGLWSGADRPFKPDTSSYDYDAPISEAGHLGEKFRLTRELFSKYLSPGETLPDVPANNPVTRIPSFTLTQRAAVFDNLPTPISDPSPRNMEAYDQSQGCILYRATVPAGPASTLEASAVHDFAWIFLDGQPLGVMDRRSRRFRVQLPARPAESRLDILVDAMGRVNFGPEVHDRKGLLAPVSITAPRSTGVPPVTVALSNWQIFSLPLDPQMLPSLKWQPATDLSSQPAFHRGTFSLSKTADTWLELSTWGKGVAWLNGRCLGRFWNIGPTQTMYVPAPWLREGQNEVVILDLIGPTSPTLAGLDKPILDQLHPELDFSRSAARYGRLALDNVKPLLTSSFPAGAAVQTVSLKEAVRAKQFCLETLSAHHDKPFATIAELDLLDPAGNPIPHTTWTVAYADSEELTNEDGSASNAIDGQTANFWHTAWSVPDPKPNHPHRLVIDLGEQVLISGLRYTPRAGNNATGRIKDYRVYASDSLVTPLTP